MSYLSERGIIMKTILSIFLQIILLNTFSFAEIIHVPTDIDSIQGGIDLAIDGDTVLVDVGTYYENIDFNGKNITVGSLFLITNDKSYIYKTVIDGNQYKNVVYFDGTIDSTAVLCGFTITNGLGYGFCEIGCRYDGGGITCNKSNPTLSNLRITKNIAPRGGGIYLESSNPKLINVTITENEADVGGGIYFGRTDLQFYKGSDSKPEFSSTNRCNIYSNYAPHGLDLFSENDTLTIEVLVDTFTVLIPDSTYAYPLNKFTFDIMNATVTNLSNNYANIPTKLLLNQNYPNPFNPSTSIEFTLPKSEFMTLKVFNILGKEVATLVSNKLNQGNHTYQFDGKNLASGIYYYQIIAGEYTEVKKMVLMK